MKSTLPRLLRSRNIARLLKLSEKWLIGEADAGRLPHIKADDVYLFDFDATEQALIERAHQRPKGDGGGR